MPMDVNPENQTIKIGQGALRNLNKLRKWAMFLAITGFICFGLIIALGIITGTFLTAFKSSNYTAGIPDMVVLAGFSLLALINFFPVLFLFRFSKHTASAVSKLDSNEMNKAIKNLKRFFIFIGVMLIGALTLYVISLILAGTSTVLIRGL